MLYQCYDEAVQAGLNAYRTSEYAGRSRSALQVASREFKECIKDIGLPYSPKLAQQWVNSPL